MSLMPGNADEMLRPGDTITDTQAAPSLEELLGKYIFSISDGKSSSSGDAAAP
jgi:phospholipid/cholesterol/gamma-HCH transport system substrate-binding protein